MWRWSTRGGSDDGLRVNRPCSIKRRRSRSPHARTIRRLGVRADSTQPLRGLDQRSSQSTSAPNLARTRSGFLDAGRSPWPDLTKRRAEDFARAPWRANPRVGRTSTITIPARCPWPRPYARGHRRGGSPFCDHIGQTFRSKRSARDPAASVPSSSISDSALAASCRGVTVPPLSKAA